MKKSGSKKRTISDEQQQECAALKALFEKRQKGLKRHGVKVNQYTAADYLGMTQSGLNQYLNGVNPLNLAVAVKMADYVGVDISDFSPRLAKEALELAQRVNEASQHKNDAVSAEKRELDHAFALTKTTKIDVRSFAQITNKEQGLEFMVVLGELPGSVFGYRLETDHMEGAPVYIQRGAMLVINPELEPIDGDLVLANIHGPAIGLLERVGGKQMLVATREKIPALDVQRSDIIGVIIKWDSEYKNPARAAPPTR